MKVNENIYYGILCFIFVTALCNAVEVFAKTPEKVEIFAAALGGFIGGGMTIFAGWLAFSEAQKSNKDNFEIRRTSVIVETLKAINEVHNEFIFLYKILYKINLIKVGNTELHEIVSHNHRFQDHEIVKSAQWIEKNFPKLLDLTALSDALVILPLWVTERVMLINKYIGSFQDDYLKAIPSFETTAAADLSWRNALLLVYKKDIELLIHEKNELQIVSRIEYLIYIVRQYSTEIDNIRTKLTEDYQSLVAGLINPPQS